MRLDKFTVAVEFAYPGHHVRARLMERQCDGSQRARRKLIIAVEPCENVTTGQAHAFIDGMGLTPIGFADDLIDTIPVCVNDAQGSVCRSSVDEDVLEVWVVLVEHRAQGFFNVGALIERWGDDGDLGPGNAAREGLCQTGIGTVDYVSAIVHRRMMA